MNLPSTGTHLTILLATVVVAIALGMDFKVHPGVGFALPLVVCCALSVAAGWLGVPLLRALKAGQVVRAEGPQAHLSKAGTPTMGGVFIVPIGVLTAVAWTLWQAPADWPDVGVVALLTLAYGLIGWLDDWQILRRRSNQGITPRQKLALQIGCSCLFCLWLILTHPEITDLHLAGWTVPLGASFWLLAGFVPVAESNATNLTDGLDGLAAGTGAVALLGLAALSPSPGLGIFCACLSGSYLGFLAHNRHPARVFMGDTGSLALGGALAGVALVSNNLWGLLWLSGLFLAESVSVIAQVSYYKATKGPDGKGRRLLKMAPWHHHLELSGWSEIQVVSFFYGIEVLLLGVSFLVN